MRNRITTSTIAIVLILSLLPISGCGILGRKKAEKQIPHLTVNRLWQMHRDINYVYFYYRDGTEKKGLLLKWNGEQIQILGERQDSPVLIPSEGLVSIKAVVGNKIWKSLAIGSALAAGYFLLVGANDLGGESLGSAVVKMFGAPLIILASVAYGSASEKTEEYLIPEGFKFEYDDIKRIHDITE